MTIIADVTLERNNKPLALKNEVKSCLMKS